MVSGSFWTSSLMAAVYQLPMLLVCVVGIGIAVLNWGRHARVSLMATVALALVLLNVAVGVFTTSLPAMLIARGSDAQQMGVVFGIIGTVRSLLGALSTGLLVVAAFYGRKP